VAWVNTGHLVSDLCVPLGLVVLSALAAMTPLRTESRCPPQLPWGETARLVSLAW
jgi:hypothetical protein